ncbi:MAG: hypothetical protein ACRDE2_15360, partial [Chitinophagaceae bacterium]
MNIIYIFILSPYCSQSELKCNIHVNYIPEDTKKRRSPQTTLFLTQPTNSTFLVRFFTVQKSIDGTDFCMLAI